MLATNDESEDWTPPPGYYDKPDNPVPLGEAPKHVWPLSGSFQRMRNGLIGTGGVGRKKIPVPPVVPGKADPDENTAQGGQSASPEEDGAQAGGRPKPIALRHLESFYQAPIPVESDLLPLLSRANVRKTKGYKAGLDGMELILPGRGMHTHRIIDDGRGIYATAGIDSEKAARLLAAIAHAKGYSTVKVRGTKAFRIAAMNALMEYGIEVANPPKEVVNVIEPVEAEAEAVGHPSPSESSNEGQSGNEPSTPPADDMQISVEI